MRLWSITVEEVLWTAGLEQSKRERGNYLKVIKKVEAIIPNQKDQQIENKLLAGSAFNQAGRSSGLTAPNGPAQTALVRSALQVAAKHPGDIHMVSLHGTGTPLGDPIEVGALGPALAPSGRQHDHIRITLGEILLCQLLFQSCAKGVLMRPMHAAQKSIVLMRPSW